MFTEKFSEVGRSANEFEGYERSIGDVVYSWSMSRRRAVKPAEVAGDGVDWLAADFGTNAPAEYARLFAKALADEMRRLEIGYRELGKMADGISHSTINGIIEGRNIPDLATIALLEKALNKELLPSQRLRKKP